MRLRKSEEHTDKVAEIQNTLRVEITVALRGIEVVAK
jgi:hypothetical protein